MSTATYELSSAVKAAHLAARRHSPDDLEVARSRIFSALGGRLSRTLARLLARLAERTALPAAEPVERKTSSSGRKHAGTAFRRILSTRTVQEFVNGELRDVEYSTHATKGQRRHIVPRGRELVFVPPQAVDRAPRRAELVDPAEYLRPKSRRRREAAEFDMWLYRNAA